MDETSLEHRISEHINEIVAARETAQKSFDVMLRRYTSASSLLRSYAAFCTDVKNDADLGKYYAARADALEAAEEDV